MTSGNTVPQTTQNAATSNASPGHVVFAFTLIALGIWGWASHDLTPIWQPVPKDLPARELLSDLCALISLATGIGVLWKRVAGSAARVLLAYLLLWSLIFKGRFIFLAPLQEATYQSCGENAVLVAGAWVLYAWFATDWDRKRLSFAIGERGVRIARVIYALAMIAFGFSHFAYLNLTAPLVPDWLPGHVGWAYFTGATYLAAGAAILFGVYARLAATLSVLQMGLFTLLVWVPRAMSGDISNFQSGEFVVSWALTAAGWVVADSYRGMPWFARSLPK
jgi:uncharacterized membrane protein